MLFFVKASKYQELLNKHDELLKVQSRLCQELAMARGEVLTSKSKLDEVKVFLEELKGKTEKAIVTNIKVKDAKTIINNFLNKIKELCDNL